MTPQERAEKLLYHYPNGIPPDYLAAQISEAEREALSIGQATAYSRCKNVYFTEGFCVSRKMAREIILLSELPSQPELIQEGWIMACEQLADRIAKMEPKMSDQTQNHQTVNYILRLEAERDRLKAELEKLQGENDSFQNSYSLLKQKAEKLTEALKSITSDRHNIGNDWDGIIKGYPDAVMCRAIAKEAIADFGVPEREGE